MSFLDTEMAQVAEILFSGIQRPIVNIMAADVLETQWTKASVTYCKTSNISRTLVGDKTVDNSDVVGASPVGAAPTTSSFST